MNNTLNTSLRRKLAMLLVFALVMTTFAPMMSVQAAEPGMEAEISPLTVLFSAKYYAENNPDVYAAFGDNLILLRQHWDIYGFAEGRRYMSPILDIHAYRAANPDLNALYGDNWKSYAEQYVTVGFYEVAIGLRSSKGVTFDAAEYLKANPELIKLANGDLQVAMIAAMQHYIAADRPKGSWVRSDSNSSTSTSSTNNGNGSNGDSGSGSNGGSSGSGSSSSGGSSKPTQPSKPGTTIPPVVNPDEPDEPVQPTHSKDSVHAKGDFDGNGECKYGCGLTLAEFQAACGMDHSAIDTGHYCPVCGAEGTNDPAEEHTRDSQHTKNSFGEDGKCLRGCGLTLEEFQNNCTENHELHIGQNCSNCGYHGTIPYDKDECPKKDGHTYGETCGYCTYEGECTEDHSQIYDTKECPVCGEAGTKHCEVNHDELFEGTFCDECGTEGTKPVPEVCENEANHGALHKGQTCPDCGTEGTADHTWDAATGKCSGDGCTEKCPNFDNHGDILQGETCEICGFEGTKEPVEQPFVCPNENNHKDLHEGVACGENGCDYVGTVEHTFNAGDENACGAKCTGCDYRRPDHNFSMEDGKCTVCGEKCTQDTCPNRTNHSTIPCQQMCLVCGSTIAQKHNYVEVDGKWICTRCEEECSHAFYHGQCSHCEATCTPETCPNGELHSDLANGEVCDTCGYVRSATVPTEHIHDWSAQDGTCAGEGECSGCPEAANHANVLTTERCGVCGAAGTKEDTTTPPTEGGDDITSGETGWDDDEDPSVSGGAGSSGSGGNSGDEDGTERSTTQNLPDAIPVKTTDGTSGQMTDGTEPNPEGEGDGEMEGTGTTGGKKDDEEDEKNEDTGSNGGTPNDGEGDSTEEVAS